MVPTGPVRAKPAAPSPFERLSDENPAPQTNPTESLDEALLVRTHRTPRLRMYVASAHTATAKSDICP